MKVKLYDKFKDWNKFDVIWLISDTHFNDADCKLMSSDWPSPEKQVELINSKIGKKDMLIHLGDVGDLDYLKKIKNCYKVLLLGNHDVGASNYKNTYKCVFSDTILYSSNSLEDCKEYALEYQGDTGVLPSIVNNKLFDEVYEGPLFINDKILLSHEPIEIPFGINIHGHCHNGMKLLTTENKCAKINIVSDIRDWIPIRLDKLIEGIKVEDIHRQTIDRAIEKPLHKNGNN